MRLAVWAGIIAGSLLMVDGAQGASLEEWEMHAGDGVVELEKPSRRHGAPAEFTHAEIPGDDDEGWSLTPDVTRPDFRETSALCTLDLACREGADFRYFQTILNLDADEKVKFFSIRVGEIDDGIRVTVFNSKFPEGHTGRKAFILPHADGGETGNLARFLVPGEANRIVVTHVDDCCGFAVIDGLEVVLK